MSLCSSPVGAWGNSGHRTACEIAWRNLTPTARIEVQRLLAAHPVIPVRAPRNRELAWACTYPDNIVQGGPGRRSAEHFVNYSRTTRDVTRSDGCGETTTCVLTAIARDYDRLRSTVLSDRERAEALIYLGHWVGDVHQPLHVSFRDDRGGNEVNSRRLCTSNLHSTWDTCILRQRVYENVAEPAAPTVREIAAAWSSSVTDEERAAWLSSEPWQWAAESFEIAIRPVVGYCVLVADTCRYSEDQVTYIEGRPRRSVPIDETYLDGAVGVIQRRVTQAGVRLAHRLNLALDPAYRS